MYESLNIPDATLIRLFDRVWAIVGFTSGDVEMILGKNERTTPLKNETRERVASIIAISLLSDRMREYASYPYVIDPKEWLYAWFRSPSEFFGNMSPLEYIRSDPASAIPKIRDTLSAFLKGDTLART